MCVTWLHQETYKVNGTYFQVSTGPTNLKNRY